MGYLFLQGKPNTAFPRATCAFGWMPTGQLHPRHAASPLSSHVNSWRSWARARALVLVHIRHICPSAHITLSVDNRDKILLLLTLSRSGAVNFNAKVISSRIFSHYGPSSHSALTRPQHRGRTRLQTHIPNFTSYSNLPAVGVE